MSAGEVGEGVMEMAQLPVASPEGKLSEPAGPKRDPLTPSVCWFHAHSLENDLGYYTVCAACGLGMR